MSGLTAEALQEHFEGMRRLAWGLLQDAAGAEDIAQETLLRALQTPPNPDRPVEPWLRKVAKNLALERLRSQRRRLRREQKYGTGTEIPTPEELNQKTEVHQQAVQMLLALEEPYKSTLMLHFFEHLSPQAIAGVQQVPAATVRSRLKRGLDQLRSKHRERYGEHWRVLLGLWLPQDRPAHPQVLIPILAFAATGLLIGFGAWFWLENADHSEHPPAPTKPAEPSEQTLLQDLGYTDD